MRRRIEAEWVVGWDEILTACCDGLALRFWRSCKEVLRLEACFSKDVGSVAAWGVSSDSVSTTAPLASDVQTESTGRGLPNQLILDARY